VKKTKSEQISDTVIFKHNHITQPTSTQVDTIVKANNYFTHALKESRNMNGVAQIEAFQQQKKLKIRESPLTRKLRHHKR
jgi:hypothetical protein